MGKGSSPRPVDKKKYDKNWPFRQKCIRCHVRWVKDNELFCWVCSSIIAKSEDS